MAILKYIIPLTTAFLMASCYEDFDPKTDAKPVLCLNSLITAGEPIKAEVTHTWIFNDPRGSSDHKVDDATVTIFVNNTKVGPEYIPQEGDRIRIVAESPTYGNAEAEVTVPRAVPISTVRATPRITDIWKGDEDFYHYAMLADITFNLNIEMVINDPEETVDFYQVDYIWRSKGWDESPDGSYTSADGASLSLGQLEYNAEPIFKEHIGVFETVTGTDDNIAFLCFTDRQFSGKQYTLHLNFTGSTFEIKSAEYNEAFLECDVILYLYTVNRSYYDWALYSWNAREGIIGDMSEIGLAESMWGYSNVSTGAGVVAARSSTRYVLSLKDFLQSALE